MKNWLALFAACSIVFLLGDLVSGDWGGLLYYLSYAGLSLALLSITTVIFFRAKSWKSVVGLCAIFVGFVELGAIVLNLTVASLYSPWSSTSLAWYYYWHESLIYILSGAELAALILPPLIIGLLDGSASRLYRSVLSGFASVFLAEHRDYVDNKAYFYSAQKACHMSRMWSSRL